MSWTVPLPQDNWKERDLFVFLREVWSRLKFATFSWNPGVIGAGAYSATTLTTADVPELEGLRTGMPIFVTAPAYGGLIHVAKTHVPADDQLYIKLLNTDSSPSVSATTTWGFMGVLP